MRQPTLKTTASSSFQKKPPSPGGIAAFPEVGVPLRPQRQGAGHSAASVFSSLHPNPGVRSTVPRARNTGRGLRHRQNEPGACNLLAEGRQALAALPGQKSSVLQR